MKASVDDGHAVTIRIDQLNAFELLNHRYLVVDKATLESFLDGSVFESDGKDPV